jgi:hypothetical protein
MAFQQRTRRSAMTIRRTITAALAATSLIAVTSSVGLAASAFEGVWKVKSTAGRSFEITLSGDGTAKASLRREMVGTWKEEGQTAVITWKTGWTTKIVKEGNQYKKIAYRKGESPSGAPTNTSEAKKVK